MIYFSSLLPKKLPKLTAELESKVHVTYLQNTKDIWARDYMPVKVGEKWVQFRYEPSYLDDVPHLRTNPKEARPKGFEVEINSLNVDGGNVVQSDTHVIMTERVFIENKELSSKSVLLKLNKVFEGKEIIIIPTEEGDLFGHSDGMVRFKANNTVLVNDYWKANYEKPFVEAVHAPLEKAGLEIVLIPYHPSNSRRKVPPATGVYVNFLETNNALYLPQFGIKQDEYVLSFFSNLYKPKKIIPINCKDLAEMGGLLNCISWGR